MKNTLLTITLFAILQTSCTATKTTASAQPPLTADPNLTAILNNIRDQHKLPALAAALVTSKGITAIAAVGTRKRSTTTPVTLNDKWHLGSNTKAMTATLIAKLIEQHKLKWTTTLAEVFPNLSKNFHPDMKNVTVLQLLTHHSGLPKDLTLNDYRGQNAPHERLRAVTNELAKAPLHKPATKSHYSNLGYIIAGAIVEKITGQSWQKNMADHIFTPLKMNHTGFGGLGVPGKINQPWPHSATGQPTKTNGPAIDNPPVMGPAGRVHCTLQDWAKFITDQLRGTQGKKAILKPATYKTLHTPPFDDQYALGWITVKRKWASGTALNHCGTNTMNYANVWLAPNRDFAILVTTNQGGDTAFKATDATVAALIKYHNKTTPSKLK